VFLARHPEEVHSRERLIDEVWQVEAVAENTLTHAIAELRKALGDDARHPRYIETIHRRGYRLLVRPGAISEEESSISRILSHYLLLEHLGGGGMGVVYRAEDTKLRRDVALKFLPKESSRDPDARERFVREARAASALDHPNICTIHEIDETPDGQLYIVMAHYDGETLKKKINRGPLPIDEALRICGEVAEGLHRAHEAGIIHRDIKPANVMVTSDGVAKIVDFGLAKLMYGKQDLETEASTHGLDTSPGTVIGTVAYMAPEQVRGESVDRRSDVFALGCLLYEMLTGERAFKEDTTAETLAAVLREEPPSLSDARPDLPAELIAVTAKALAKDVDRRYQSARAFLSDLEVIQGQTDEGEALTEAPPSRKPAHRRLYLAPVLVALALFVGTVAVIWFVRSSVVEEPVDTTPPRIVVLPFENLGPSDDEYFADGMTEEIISRLSAVSGLRVISRTSAMQYKGTSKGIAQIGEELNVQYALEGTVRWERSGEGHGRVRITPQLIKVADDSHLWSDRYDRAIESVFEVQSDIAGQVVERLHVSLLKPEQDAIDARPTDNPEAYEAFLRAQHHIQTNEYDQSQLAVMMYKRAVELDPEFAIAWAHLGRLHAYVYFTGWDRTPERRAAAKQAVERALALDTASAEGRWAQGYYHYYCERDFQRALEEFDQALEVRPYDLDSLKGRAFILRRQERWEESNSAFERILESSPRDFLAIHEFATNLNLVRDFRRAEEYVNMEISLRPDLADGYIAKYYLLFGQGRFSEARAVIEELPIDSPFLNVQRIYLDIADGEYEAALTRVRGTPDALYERAWGRLGTGARDLQECQCYFYLGGQRGLNQACERARIAYEELTRKYPDENTYHRLLGITYGILGRKDDAIREGERAVALLPVSKDALDGTKPVRELAYIYTLVGEQEAAIDQIEYLLSIPSILAVGELRVHHGWDPLRDHPRFQALLEKYDTN
jgi:serine/threonine protein kinase/tetratricopeptide (TPR) repeat protein